MKAIIGTVLTALAAGGGVFAADMMKPAPSTETVLAEAQASASDATGAKTPKKGQSVKSDSVSYLKFKRQFVIPVLKENGVDALILMNIALVLDEDAKDGSFNHEPKFRDAFIRELLQFSDAGYFDKAMTSPATYEALRETLLRAAREVSPEAIEDVLILDLARQDR